MIQDSAPSGHPVQTVVEAGQILQKLTPARVATLLFVADGEIEKQTEMADVLDISRSTITNHLQKLEDLPVSLVVRQREYEMTPIGEEIVGILVRMFNRLGENLHDVDWEDPAERKHIGNLLAPLHSTRSVVPFFVLYSVGQHSTVEDKINIMAPSQPVQVGIVVDDVKSWQKDRGETATRKQIRAMLGRFEEADSLEITDRELILTDQGKEHAKLLEDVVETIESSRAADSNEDSSLESTHQDSTSTDTQAEPSPATNTTERGSQQLSLKGFHPNEVDDAGGSDAGTTVPAYGVSSAKESSDRTQSNPQLSSVLLLTPTATVAELTDQLNRIGRAYGDDAQLELYWAELASESDTDSERDDKHPQPQQ